MKTSILFTSLMALTVSCNAQWGKKIKGNGNTVTINRNVGDYEEIALAGWFDVELIDGQEGALTLVGESNLLEHIETEVKQGKLTIKVAKGVNLVPSSWDQGILIKVPVETIDGLTLSGSGDIESKKTIMANNFMTTISGSGDIRLMLEANTIDASISGSGDITLSGKTTNFEASISGSGDIKAYDLVADHVDATVSGSADIKVTSNKSLTGRVSGSGDITYRGNPQKIDTKASGSGDISKE